MANGPDKLLAADGSIERDLYCLNCGYNLRGLAGDPVRCPECGNLNPIGDVEIPAAIIREQLRRLESAPAWCVAAIVFGAPWMVLATIMLPHASTPATRGPDCGLLGCLGLPLILAIATWLGCVAAFRASCQGKPGWAIALALYHFWGLLLIVAAVGGVLGGMAGLLALKRYVPLVVWIALVALGLVGLSAGIRFGVKTAHRLAIERLEPLQREVAVKIARETLRKRMARQRRGLLG